MRRHYTVCLMQICRPLWCHLHVMQTQRLHRQICHSCMEWCCPSNNGTRLPHKCKYCLFVTFWGLYNCSECMALAASHLPLCMCLHRHHRNIAKGKELHHGIIWAWVWPLPVTFIICRAFGSFDSMICVFDGGKRSKWMITEYTQSQRRFRLRWFCSYYRYDGNGHNYEGRDWCQPLGNRRGGLVVGNITRLIISLALMLQDCMAAYRALSVAKNTMNGVSLFDVNITESLRLRTRSSCHFSRKWGRCQCREDSTSVQYLNSRITRVDFSHEMLGEV